MKQHHKVCISFLLSACLFAGQSAQAADKLTLPESVSLAIKNNPIMQISEANFEKARWNLKEVRAYNGVSLKYNLLYGRSDQAPSWYPNVDGSGLPAWSDTYTFYHHQLALTLPLYTGHKLESMSDLAKRGTTVADLERTANRQRLTLDVTNTYYNELQALNMVRVATEAVEDFSIHLTNVKHQFDVGNVALSDVLQTEVRLANARNNLIKAQSAAKMARYKLNTVIGIALTDDAQLDDQVSREPYTATLEESLAEAFKHRPEMKQADLSIAMAKDKIKIAQSDSKPTVAAVAQENIKDTVSPSSSKDKNDWTAGVNVSFNVFDNGVTRSKTKGALSELDAAKEQKRQLQDGITLEVSNAYLNVEESFERIKNNEVAVNQSQRDYAMAQERYFAGIGTNLDVMDAEVAMTQAKTNYVVAIYDYVNSRAQLSKAKGMLY